jgi:AcrR family transcriptional regulator
MTAAFEDLTARARIRQAALEQFAEHGYERATIRGIAAAAGVSPGLVRHHFGSKEALRDAVDAYVMEQIHEANDQVMADAERGDLGPSVIARAAARQLRPYLVRALHDGSPTLAKFFDEIVVPTEAWFARADKTRPDPPYADTRTRAAVFTAMVLGVALLNQHVSRVLGVDILSEAGDQQIALAMLDLYSHSLVSPELAESALAALKKTTPQDTRSEQ